MGNPTYQSLYRRYRPQRFGDVLDQDHITVALRNAVRDGRVGHAYLFSGPRGCGKTSTARILAKVLNCANPVDGEPDGTCDNCVAVERGQVVDWLLEQDAASKSKVDDMRDLLDRVPLGTSGRRKVIILDEVHMLSQGAENALLKTLEEPPDHVVFVLATTDPQKVRATIRSRTQHFAFHLVSPDIMAELVRHVIADAGLSVDDVDAAVDHVVRVGGGSVRDTLSSLDQVAALGRVVSDAQPVDLILEAVAAQDAGATLVAVADAMATGRDPRGLGEAIIGRLRNAFLALMGVADEHLPPAERDSAQALGKRFGAAGLTRALDVLGEALTDLARKPDPRVVLEVALIRLVRPDTDRSIDAVLERLARLEHAVQTGAVGSGGGGGGGGDRSEETVSSDPAPAAPEAATPVAPAPSRGESSGPAASASPPPSSSPGPPASDGPTASPGPTSPEGQGGGPGGPASAARAVLAARQGKGGGPAVPSVPRPSSEAQASGSGSSTPAPSSSTSADPAPSSGTAAPAAGQDAPVRPDEPGGSPAPSADSSGGPSSAAKPSPASSGPATTASASAPAPASPQSPTPDGPASGGAVPDLSTLNKLWSEQLLGELPVSVRSKWRGGRWIDSRDGQLRFAVPNQWHLKACEPGKLDVEKALAAHLGQRFPVQLVDEAAGGAPAPTSSSPGAGDLGMPQNPPPSDDDVPHPDEIADLPDAGDVTVGGVDLLRREFGGELVQEENREP